MLPLNSTAPTTPTKRRQHKKGGSPKRAKEVIASALTSVFLQKNNAKINMALFLNLNTEFLNNALHMA
jgi:hypothetical protein